MFYDGGGPFIKLIAVGREDIGALVGDQQVGPAIPMILRRVGPDIPVLVTGEHVGSLYMGAGECGQDGGPLPFPEMSLAIFDAGATGEDQMPAMGDVVLPFAREGGVDHFIG